MVSVARDEPVAVSDLVKLASVVAAYLGLELPEDTWAKAVAAVVALIVFAQSTWFARSRVTPDQRAKAALRAQRLEMAEREKCAYDEGVAVGEAAATPKVTVVEVGADKTVTDQDGGADPDMVGAQSAWQWTGTSGTTWADIGQGDAKPPPDSRPGPPPAPTRIPPPDGLDR